jgi:hypothetical protein
MKSPTARCSRNGAGDDIVDRPTSEADARIAGHRAGGGLEIDEQLDLKPNHAPASMSSSI